jgi:Asp-tRNA(Asn)/Glu-tRNA(Gln) amidotransferase A subunit family amidase
VQDLVETALARIAELDGEVRAWVEVAPQPPLGEGPLSGIPFGAKDIFETRGMATEYGSPLYAGRKGDCDAALIVELRRKGAVLLGKTHTTAFASFDPAPTRNPRLPGYTPGGSSAGSAAAVAAGMVPFALGTQTLGSVLRPASYCGVCGLKPTHGRLSMEGVLPFAPSQDTAGFFTETARFMARVWEVFSAPGSSRVQGAAAYLRTHAEEPMARAVEDAVARLRACGLTIDAVDPPQGWAKLIDAAFTINSYEGARTHAARYREFGVRMGARLAGLIARGLEMPEEEYLAARAHVERMRGVFSEYALVLSPAATGPAPAGFDSTGDPAANAPWTALGRPAISVPLPVTGAPLGLQITAPRGHDDFLVGAAVKIEEWLT